ncbi:hypothetical protein [Cyanobacterium sp. uoEpiScrs1]|uniref:hypothetical protein n=1 Tax=Cyanobacterium sp. uoEpiScrs1 TaxID=2976343 RepID=UPI00226A5314|nr:hypothetical protein [Cyanobacterium sp. uoEpiScrs1]
MSFVPTLLFSLTHLQLLPTTILLSLLISSGTISAKFAQATEESLSHSRENLSEEVSFKRTNSLANGVYLYGRSPEPEIMGQEYLVFKVQKGEVIGAFYMPRSEFNCFSGSFDSRQINLSIVDPYDGIEYDYSISLRVVSPVANHDQQASEVTLEGYYRLGSLSNNDQRILNACLPSG